MRNWQDYNPAWLIEASASKTAEYPWLKDALAECKSASIESDFYIHFVDPSNPNEPDSLWQFETSIVITDTKEGDLVLDILKGQKVGGIEFLSKLID